MKKLDLSLNIFKLLNLFKPQFPHLFVSYSREYLSYITVDLVLGTMTGLTEPHLSILGVYAFATFPSYSSKISSLQHLSSLFALLFSFLFKKILKRFYSFNKFIHQITTLMIHFLKDFIYF